MSYRVIQGDCLEGMRTLDDKSVHCCVKSPLRSGVSMTEPTWQSTTQLIAELWPAFSPTHAQQSEYKRTLSMRHQSNVQAAIRAHHSEDADSRFGPQLSRIIERCRAHSPPVVWKSQADCDAEEVESDHARMLRIILGWPAERLAAAINHASVMPVGVDATTLVGDPREWKRFAIGCVHACDWYLNRNREHVAR